MAVIWNAGCMDILHINVLQKMYYWTEQNEIKRGRDWQIKKLDVFTKMTQQASCNLFLFFQVFDERTGKSTTSAMTFWSKFGEKQPKTERR